MRSITVNKNDEGQRLDKFVQKTVWGMPLSLVYKFIRLKRIKVNSKKADFSYRLKLGDVVDFYIPETFERPYVSPEEFFVETPALDIVYEDDNILICNKPAGMLVHPGDNGEVNSETVSERETLLFHIKSYLAQKGDYDPAKENSFAPSLCNRIDRNTGGLVIAAKNAPALRNMNDEIKNGGVKKEYLCVVHGEMESDSEVLEAFLKKDPSNKKVFVGSSPSEGAKRIVTEYKVLQYNKELDLSLLNIRLHTGRTHQIRAHMAHIGHPLLGDGKYADNSKDRAMGWDHQALYSYSISFLPTTDFYSYLNGVVVKADTGKILFMTLFSK